MAHSGDRAWGRLQHGVRASRADGATERALRGPADPQVAVRPSANRGWLSARLGPTARLGVALAGLGLGCAGEEAAEPQELQALQQYAEGGEVADDATSGSAVAGDGQASLVGDNGNGRWVERCDPTLENRESTRYDTSGDGNPDVLKVYRRVGSGASARLVLICRETDLNGDGRNEVIRYYNDDGAAVREDADRNLDGRVDMIVAYQDGQVVQREFDDDHDGRIDAKVFYAKGQPLRAERDLVDSGASASWQPDRWEYFEDGKLLRMGTDVDGDGQIDRWDRIQRAESPRESEETVESE